MAHRSALLHAADGPSRRRVAALRRELRGACGSQRAPSPLILLLQPPHVPLKVGLLAAELRVDLRSLLSQLCKLFPREDWDPLSHTLIFHGRRVCFARKPECDRCAVKDVCPSAGEGAARRQAWGATPPSR